MRRYFDILNGRQKPRFQEVRRRPTGLACADLEKAGLDSLWRAHDEAMNALKTGAPAGEIQAGEANLLELKAAIAERMLAACCFCERRCLADRAAGKLGTCGVPSISRYASEFFHFGEEAELVPSHTIFFTGCNFSCVYCQNWDIATRPTTGTVAVPKEVARIIDRGHKLGSHNVNFVGGNPDPHLHTCLKTISLLETNIPVVWNSNAYASLESMKLLDGAVDIFLSDFRYGNDGCAKKYSHVSRYFAVVSRNILAASRQAEVMLRHLVLPGHLMCCTRPILQWVSEHMPGVYFNLMFQYRPEYKATKYAGLDRRLTLAEMKKARALAQAYGI